MLSFVKVFCDILVSYAILVNVSCYPRRSYPCRSYLTIHVSTVLTYVLAILLYFLKVFSVILVSYASFVNVFILSFVKCILLSF